MKKYIAYCGLDCESCEARRATVNDDDSLRQHRTIRLRHLLENLCPDFVTFS